MNARADAARLTIQFREPSLNRCEELAADVVRRSHAAGMLGATVYRGGPPAQTQTIPAQRSVSLADEEGVTVCVVGAEEHLRGFAGQLGDLGQAVVRLEIAGRIVDLDPQSAFVISKS